MFNNLVTGIARCSGKRFSNELFSSLLIFLKKEGGTKTDYFGLLDLVVFKACWSLPTFLGLKQNKDNVINNLMNTGIIKVLYNTYYSDP